jgi:hypothetical protein
MAAWRRSATGMPLCCALVHVESEGKSPRLGFLRSGERDEGDATLMAHLEATIADKIAIANPKWR